MWFGDEMTTIYDMAIHPAIEAAGYSPMRIDRTEHNNKIDDQIISEIRRSKFLIADFTSYEVTTKNDDGGSENHYIPRGGVYYEAGFAKGLGKDVIWTCRKDQHEKLHFDIRQYNNILWESQGELKERLQVRIEATLGEGPLKK